MRALFFSIGTRGDAEPFMALAQILKNQGWEVACCFPEQFRELVTSMDIPFYGFDRRFLELLEGDTGKVIMGGSGGAWVRFKAFIGLVKSSIKLQSILVGKQQQVISEYQPEKVFYHPKCVYPIIWELGNPGKTIMVCPMPCVVHEVKELSTMAFRGNGDFGPFLNVLSYRLVNAIRSRVFNRMTQKFRQELSGIKVSPGIIKDTILNRTKTLYTISPTLFPRPKYWGDHLFVTGYYERSKTSNWEPTASLLSFLGRYEKILFITFGSMKNTRPRENTAVFLQILAKYRIAAVVNTSWGGLMAPDHYPEHIHFVENLPYEWIFPKMYAAVHHGGSGTTHTACKHGCPSLIIPHIVDQYFWNQTIKRQGLGPLGIPIKHLSPMRLEPLLLDLMNNGDYKARARRIQLAMAGEGNEQELLKIIDQ